MTEVGADEQAALSELEAATAEWRRQLERCEDALPCPLASDQVKLVLAWCQMVRCLLALPDRLLPSRWRRKTVESGDDM